MKKGVFRNYGTYQIQGLYDFLRNKGPVNY